MNKYFSRVGYFAIGISLSLFVIIWIFWSFSFLVFFIFLFFLFLFRVPKRTLICVDEKAILSPIDGKILKIQNLNHHLLGECIEINIKNSFYHPGTFYACFKMKIDKIKTKHGLFLCNNLKVAKNMNENISIFANTDNRNIIYKIYAGSMDRKLYLYDIYSDLNAGDEIGFFINGNISLFLPKDKIRIQVGLGDKIKAGALIGYLE
ncbi:phosphatidylserine decarboxylase [Campylobacter novaezeelandiae]|uniref:Phosphatidylserine decarboxylase n=2 Tax=Campylobacter novaezeelandiae TaxID=2267891 RepID=A0A4V2JQG5_9BACT|nr:phosphatidylserine decarboxylase [Campylobacter novaezeelandiae]MBK1964429.1 phosphatidylserine decarboxylase [Campylobacter novaezeelandiae]TBR78581.1 phosphatidylserine decarboxylase [Campylobacter novaezeelandiae]TBR80502.1 phosphatidylserine decarboxylase [Campylobacter novaezeelandiae]